MQSHSRSSRNPPIPLAITSNSLDTSPSLPVSCFGGKFAILAVSNAEDTPLIDITGTIICGEISIKGEFTQQAQGAETCDYEASFEGCYASNIGLKANVEAISASREGFNLYKFQYLSDADENTYVGVMAQDVMSRHPEAIVQNEFGLFMVQYHVLGLKMVTLNEWELEGPYSLELKY